MLTVAEGESLGADGSPRRLVACSIARLRYSVCWQRQIHLCTVPSVSNGCLESGSDAVGESRSYHRHSLEYLRLVYLLGESNFTSLFLDYPRQLSTKRPSWLFRPREIPVLCWLVRQALYCVGYSIRASICLEGLYSHPGPR